MKDYKIIIGLAVGVIIVGGIIWAVSSRTEKQSVEQMTSEEKDVEELPLGEQDDIEAEDSESDSPNAPVKATTGNPSGLTYTQAVQVYKDRRIQFDAECNATPTQPVYKNPVTIMLDNRANELRNIVIDGKTYAIKPYDFAIITLNQKTSPSYSYVACNAKKNVAKITLQK